VCSSLTSEANRLVALRELEAVHERRLQHCEAVAAASRRSRQVHHERCATQAREAPRQQGVRRPGEGISTDSLRDPRRLTVEHRTRRLGRDVPGGETRSAGREDEGVPACEIDDRGSYHVGLVRHDTPFDLEPLRGEQLRESIPAPIFSCAVVDTIRHGQHGSPHTGPLVFSTRVTSEIVIALSIALAMS